MSEQSSAGTKSSEVVASKTKLNALWRRLSQSQTRPPPENCPPPVPPASNEGDHSSTSGSKSGAFSDPQPSKTAPTASATSKPNNTTVIMIDGFLNDKSRTKLPTEVTAHLNCKRTTRRRNNIGNEQQLNMEKSNGASTGQVSSGPSGLQQ